MTTKAELTSGSFICGDCGEFSMLNDRGPDREVNFDAAHMGAGCIIAECEFCHTENIIDTIDLDDSLY